MTDKPSVYRFGTLRVPRWARGVLDIAVLPEDQGDIARTKRLVAGVLWASIPISTMSAIQLGVVFDAPPAGWAVGAAVLVNALALLALWLAPRTYPNIVHLPVGMTVLLSFALVIMAGGLLESGMNAVWGFVGILGALAVFGDRRATLWLWVFIGSQLIAVAWATRIEPLYEVTNIEFAALFNLVVVGLFVYYMLFYYVRQRALLMEQSESLLRNILPAQVAERLKVSDRAIADDYEEASILFADVVDFTPMSAGMAPAELVALLDEVFSAIDALVEKRGLEKIKTIGDAYMVASGVPVARDDHAIVICDLALAIQDLVATREFRGRRISLRMGINSGPVVAGIIGTRKFSYDLWGDAVNTASRMESSGRSAGIQITERTKSLVENRFSCEPKGVVDVKGKGPMPVWALVRRRREA